MGQAKERAAAEAAERAAWADGVIADVRAIEAAALRDVLAGRPDADTADGRVAQGPLLDIELERMATLTTWGVFRSLGADVADAIDAAAGEEEEYDGDAPERQSVPFVLTKPKAAPGGILPE